MSRWSVVDPEELSLSKSCRGEPGRKFRLGTSSSRCDVVLEILVMLCSGADTTSSACPFPFLRDV